MMNLPFKDLIIGVVAGYVLKMVWGQLGVGAGFSLEALKINVGGAWAIAFAVTVYGALKARRFLYIGLAMLAGVFLREQTSPTV